MLHEYKIRFTLTDAQHEALAALAAQYNRVMGLGVTPEGPGVTPEGMLETLLATGSAYMIDERIAGTRAALERAETRLEAAPRGGGDA